MSEQSPLAYAHQHRDRFLDELKELLSIPSISTLPEYRPDMILAARWLTDRLRDVGIEAEMIQEDGHPLVYGEWLHASHAPTVLLYGHYDVQPVDPLAQWTTPPFEPTVRDGNIYARGAADDKGQLMTMVYAAESFLRTQGKLPINIKILIEGEEESSGGAIKTYVAEHGDRLRADVVEVADTSMFAPGLPSIETGLRGNVYTEVHAHGASHDLHSGLYGGVAPNPLNALGHVIAGLKATDGHITIPGFYDEVHMPDQQTLASWQKLPLDAAELTVELGVSELAGEQRYTPLERMWARPTLDVHGIPGGFTDVGAKTVIPADASAKISMRLVPNQRADHIFELFRRRVLELSSPGIGLEVQLLHGDDPVIVPSDSPYVRLAADALQQTFGRPAVLTRSGGSIPIVTTFKRSLGINSVLMGWGLPDDHLHGPNEKFSLENFHQGIATTIRFWQLVGQHRHHS